MDIWLAIMTRHISIFQNEYFSAVKCQKNIILVILKFPKSDRYPSIYKSKAALVTKLNWTSTFSIKKNHWYTNLGFFEGKRFHAFSYKKKQQWYSDNDYWMQCNTTEYRQYWTNVSRRAPQVVTRDLTKPKSCKHIAKLSIWTRARLRVLMVLCYVSLLVVHKQEAGLTL